jgi:hypothetical protein
MKIVSLLTHERRLVLLCAVSAALHLLVIGWVAAPAQHSPARDAAPRIAVSLQPLDPSAPPSAAAAAFRSMAAPVPKRSVQRTPALAPAADASAPAQPLQAAQIAPLAGAGWNPLAEGTGEAPVQLRGRYRVRVPPPSLLTYAVTRTAGAATAPAGAGQLDWRYDDKGYSLRFDGVAGSLSSSGAMGDAGIAPASASEVLADGARAETRFDEQSRRIAFSGSGNNYMLAQGSQDRASLLMQLAGIGLAEPDQVKDVLEFYVGGATEAGVVRFQVLGEEQLDSAIGKLASVHLVQLAQPGQARLEVWLAPQHHWLPVQLRVTAADGSVLTQLVTAISAR